MKVCISQSTKEPFMATSSYPTLMSLIDARQTQLGVTDAALTLALGYEHERVIGLIKNGQMRFPLTKVLALAEALTVDAREVLRLVMAESMPGAFDVIEQVLNPLKLAEHEIG